MAETIKIICENTGKSLYVEMGTSLADVLNMLTLKSDHPFLAAYVNNVIKELSFRIFAPLSVRFIDITHFEGMRVYQRTLFFILHKAVIDTYPDKHLKIKHSVAKGFYCELDDNNIGVTEEEVQTIKNRMEELISQNLPIVGETVIYTEAEEICRQYGFYDKIQLMETRPHLYVTLHRLADLPGYFYGTLAPSTGYITLFDLKKYFKGMYLGVPCRTNPSHLEKMIPQNKMFDIFTEYKNWVNILGVANIGSLNSMILEGKTSDLIKIAESFHEKKLGHIADIINDRSKKDGTRIILISGPSSSGKTTFAKRLGIQLRILGMEPVMISLDNYFVDRDKTPIDENGEHDFEALEAVNVPLFNEHLVDLLNGEEVSVPKYDFYTGTSVPDSYKLKLQKNSIIIIEGIHALNPKLTPDIDADKKFHVYVSALTSTSMDDLTRIATTDNRLLRRIVRDYRFRNNDAKSTIKRWQSVRRGEEEHIFPFQEQADIMFNSSLFFELSILKNYAEPLLHEVPNTVPEYAEAQRLLNFLDLFVPIGDKEVPLTSILKEFIGGSSFNYD
ncbi:MAG: nucleoside kinase [Rikenellaceae bacterium]|nr:nucleoside kinase [Rikenellaceae bacterium]